MRKGQVYAAPNLRRSSLRPRRILDCVRPGVYPSDVKRPQRDAPVVLDFFAGCGGLSLGLERAGFFPAYVNELNLDALRTYWWNRKSINPRLERLYSRDAKELVRDAGSGVTDLIAVLAREYGVRASHGEIDLVVGGPPCQGFSGIGHRRSYSVEKEQLPSNHLYQDYAYVISKLRPKLFLFENVKGLLSARWSASGSKGEIWSDVLDAFKSLGEYSIAWTLVHAKDYGVPQNRPRVLLVGIRSDLGVAGSVDAVEAGLLPAGRGGAPDLDELLGDLIDPEFEYGGATPRYPSGARNGVQRLLREEVNGGRVRGRGEAISDHEYSNHSPRVRAKFRAMLENGGHIPAEYQTKKFAQRLLPATWGKGGPTITATSLPDDYVHFAQPRTLTVREWARLQCFPDWYEFYGKRTTGGIRRAGNPREGLFDRELPKYTQIGNAVPVWLAEAVGRHFRELLGR